MHPDGFGGRTNIGNMVGIAEEIDGGLAVEEEEVFVDGCTGGRRGIGQLGQDDHTLFITRVRGIISVHSMNLRRRRLLAFRAHSRGMTELAT